MLRQEKVKDVEETLQRQTYYLHPHRYQDLFLAGAFEPEPLTMGGRDVEEVVEDVDEMDAYFDSLEQKRGMTGADLFSLLDEPDAEGWM